MAPAETGGGWSLINLGELSKPGTVLIEKVSEAIGGIFRPWQIKRVAIAEAEGEVQSDIIRAKGRLVISEIEERGLIRMVYEQGKIQENIESITSKAIPLLTENAKPESVENDWVTRFFDRCRQISDAEMQTVWATILAGQANNPGKFSKKTLDLVAPFDAADIHLFTNLCTFVWEYPNRSLLVYDVMDEIYNEFGINFSSIEHLEDMGLVKFMEFGHYMVRGVSKQTSVSYYGRELIIEFPNEVNDMITGQVMFTRAGEQLASICGAVKSDNYFEFVLEKRLSEGCILSSPWPPR